MEGQTPGKVGENDQIPHDFKIDIERRLLSEILPSFEKNLQAEISAHINKEINGASSLQSTPISPSLNEICENYFNAKMKTANIKLHFDIAFRIIDRIESNPILNFIFGINRTKKVMARFTN